MTIALPLPRRGTTPASFLNGADVLHPGQGWYADPACAQDARWWDGRAWGAQRQANSVAAQAFPHPETLNEHVHDAIDSLWLGRLDQILRATTGRPVAGLPARAGLVADRPTSSVVPLEVPALTAAPAVRPVLPAALAVRITAERHAGSTWQAIADRLNRDAVPTSRGGSQWRIRTVQNAAGHVRTSAPVRPLPLRQAAMTTQRDHRAPVLSVS